MRVGYFVKGLGNTPWLDAFLEADTCCVPGWAPKKDVTHIAGWGLKPTAEKARRFAAARGLPYISLEDGFLRSLGLGVSGAPLHSLIVDYTGIYYDATRPSDLETRIAEQTLTSGQLNRARQGIELLRRCRLSKYNHAPDRAPEGLEPGVPRVLVVDQTAGDASIQYGLASADSFAQMLEAAVAEKPGSEILVKVHPDVVAGKKQGHLLELARRHGCRLVSDDVSPWALLDVVGQVYVVTSQLGFEALLAGKTVHCFGVPFYAGWGLTEDRVQPERRGFPRRLEAVFHAAYLDYCRYINPYTGQRCEFEDTVALLADQKRVRDRFAGDWAAFDFASWKRNFVGRFLGTEASVSWCSSQQTPSQSKWLVWASKLTPELVERSRIAGAELWRVEDGFIRSAGLGVDLIEPLSLVIDSCGIYYDATGPSDLENLLNEADIPADLCERAKRLRQRLVEQKLSKYNVGVAGKLPLPSNRKIILVPGQVETDASIRTGALELRTNLELLKAVREAEPEAFIVYKPHPDVLSGARVGDLEGADYFDLEVRDIAMPDLLEQVDEVHTLTSLTGFEALMRGVPVTTWGLPFYAGWGLTRDKLHCPRRIRERTLDELVAATLILYPVYVDPDSGHQVNAETAVEVLQRQRQKPPRLSLRSRVWRRVRKRV
jgi:capsular polysaccharide export protein